MNCEEAYVVGAEDGEDLLQRNELVGGGEAVSVGAPERPGLLVAHEHIDRVALGHREPCAAPHSACEYTEYTRTVLYSIL